LNTLSEELLKWLASNAAWRETTSQLS